MLEVLDWLLEQSGAGIQVVSKMISAPVWISSFWIEYVYFAFVGFLLSLPSKPFRRDGTILSYSDTNPKIARKLPWFAFILVKSLNSNLIQSTFVMATKTRAKNFSSDEISMLVDFLHENKSQLFGSLSSSLTYDYKNRVGGHRKRNLNPCSLRKWAREGFNFCAGLVLRWIRWWTF